MATDRIVATKSKVLYVRLILGALTWVALWLGVVSLVSALFKSAHVAVHESTFGPWTFLGVGLIVLWAIPKWLTVSSTSWSVDDEWVTIREGWLPWARKVFEIPFDTIFEAFWQAGFLGHFLGYAHCTIRRTEGNTTALVLTYARNSRDLVGAINEKVNDLRKARRPAETAASEPPNTADEIAKLVRLRDQGDINEEEFAALKKKLVDPAVR